MQLEEETSRQFLILLSKVGLFAPLLHEYSIVVIERIFPITFHIDRSNYSSHLVGEHRNGHFRLRSAEGGKTCGLWLPVNRFVYLPWNVLTDWLCRFVITNVG
jgi:hypothetical protein